MIQSRPKLKGKKLIAISLLLLILTVILFPVSSFAGRSAAIVQICAIVSAGISIFILTKYVIPDYLYTLDNGHFTIHKVTKSQSLCVADIELLTATTQLMTVEEYKKQTKSRKVYSYIKNPSDSDIRYIAFSLDDSEFAVAFEPDELFRTEFSKALEAIKYEEDED